MIAWIARHLPKRIRFEVAQQFLRAAVEFSPKGMDSTLREIGENHQRRGRVEGWIE